MLKSIFFIAGLIFLASCSYTEEENGRKLNTEIYPPKLTDTKPKVTLPLSSKSLRFFDFTALAIHSRDHARINLSVASKVPYVNSEKQLNIIDPNFIQLFVDTTQIFEHEIFYLPSPASASTVNIQTDFITDHHPVFLFNNSSDSLNLVLVDGCLQMVQEARDSSGVWRPLSFMESPMCGNSYSVSPALTNTNLLVSKAIIFDGVFKTKLRLRLNLEYCTIFSNEYSGSINHDYFCRPSRIIYSKEEIKILENS